VGKGHVTPASVDRDGNANLIDAARTVGAHYVLMSVIGASPNHPLELFRMKAAAEQHLQHSDLPWTVVRAGAFLELYQDLMRRTATRSRRPLVFGRGGNPIQFASISQVATVIERALTDPSARGTVIQVDGPFMTFNQLAASLAPELGAGASRPRHVPRNAALHGRRPIDATGPPGTLRADHGQLRPRVGPTRPLSHLLAAGWLLSAGQNPVGTCGPYGSSRAWISSSVR
jgi:NADH dehydrogenase